MPNLTFNQLPIEIQQLATLEARKIKSSRILEPDCRVTGFFPWDSTKDGSGFWCQISEGNFDYFYKKYPKKLFKEIKLCLL